MSESDNNANQLVEQVAQEVKKVVLPIEEKSMKMEEELKNKENQVKSLMEKLNELNTSQKNNIEIINTLNNDVKSLQERSKAMSSSGISLNSDGYIDNKSLNDALNDFASVLDGGSGNQRFTNIDTSAVPVTNINGAKYEKSMSALFDSAGFFKLPKKEQKSMLRTDSNTYGGYAISDADYLGSADINKLPVSPIMSYVNIASAGVITRGVIDTFDYSKIEMFNECEGDPVKQTELLKMAQINIPIHEYASSFPLTNTMYNAYRANELRYNPFLLTMQGLEADKIRRWAKEIFIGSGNNEMLGILTKANKQNSILSNQILLTETSNSVTVSDLRNLESMLKANYLSSPNLALFVARDLLIQLRKEKGADEHLTDSEYFESSQYGTGLRFKTATAGSIPVIVMPNGVGLDYKLYNPSNQFTNKPVAMLADLKQGYLVAQSSFVETGLDTSIGNAARNGARLSVMFSYAGGAPVVEEAIAILKIKN